MKNFRREYSNISLRNALEIIVPRGQIWTLVNIINIHEEERKKRKKSRDKYSGGLTEGAGVGSVRRKIKDLVGPIGPDFPTPRKKSRGEIYSGGLTGGRASKNPNF